jgi:hypothetical protein
VSKTFKALAVLAATLTTLATGAGAALAQTPGVAPVSSQADTTGYICVPAYSDFPGIEGYQPGYFFVTYNVPTCENPPPGY